MGKMTAAVDTLDRLAVQLSGIQEAAKQLREIGSYEGAIEALQKQKDALLKEIETERNTLEEVRRSQVIAKNDAEAEVRAIKEKAGMVIDEAEKKANSIVKSAEAQAEMSATTERRKREGTLQDIQKQIQDEQAKLKAAQDKTAQATKKAEAVERRAEAAQQALDSINDAVKAQAQSLAAGG